MRSLGSQSYISYETVVVLTEAASREATPQRGDRSAGRIPELVGGKSSGGSKRGVKAVERR